jgi:CRISPR-associated endonuclease/helicase Cas3
MKQAKSFQPYPFQIRVFKLLMNGRSVILQAPTGSGKTRAALMPFQQNLGQRGDALPFTCRYAVPLRVLANQFFAENAALAEQMDLAAPTKLVERYRQLEAEAVAVQTGEQPDDPQFESVLTFCTIDQLLASFLAVPYGLGPNRANINVAGIAGSYLVLDEFHLYPLLNEGQNVFGARTTTLTMLRLLKSTRTPFILMTATFSSALLTQLADLLDAEIVQVSEQEYQQIAQGRARTFWRADGPMDAARILAEHQQREGNKATLVVCNTVARAQRLYLQLRQVRASGTRVILLHSRFSKEDRRRLSAEVEQALGEAMWQDGVYRGPDIIVIATQVVEVGLNISVHTLHTEVAPANSIIQRAGRCARFPRQQGQVIVYPLPPRDDEEPASTLPYRKDLCEATWETLKDFHGDRVGFAEEQQLIDRVHESEDRDLLRRFQQYENEIRRLLFKSYTTNDCGVTSQLIRDVSQVHILIHSNPESITETPWRWESFSIHPGSLASERRWSALQERARNADLEWMCRKAEPLEEAQQEPDGADGIDNRQKTVYRWEPVSSSAVAAQSLLIALPPQLARYDGELGFVLLDGEFDDLGLSPNGYESELLAGTPGRSSERWSSQQSYQDHISGLLRAYKSGLRDDIAYTARRLEEEMSLPAGIIDQAIRLAIACHDLGKLNRTWQQWAFNWQTRLAEMLNKPTYQLPEPAFCFAKTDNQSAWKLWQSDVKPKRPPHACESVKLARRLIADSLGISKESGQERRPLLRAICGAIARHHTSRASAYEPAQLDERAKAAALEALRLAHAGSSWSYNPDLLELSITKGGDLQPETASSSWLTRPTYEDGEEGLRETWLYFLLVRTLRLADQRAGS